ncbi:hypothetical protein AHMF7616_04153 [Adhaeribacter pallidiroseus]|uniref:Uncharacterized protein n=1 Tax=Adhaeribacter pallidiroseus TaxID=2072847 RepID=A0A369QKT1_9BACT|nr:hypothetical protein AHMF7616_04153 [Adhaeribacter pallidiroseus]
MKLWHFYYCLLGQEHIYQLITWAIFKLKIQVNMCNNARFYISHSKTKTIAYVNFYETN